MRTDHGLPPRRTLPAGRLDAREGHLLAEIEGRRQQRPWLRARTVAPAAVALAALAATPALALSTTVRQLVGIDAKRSPAPALEARITGVTVHRRPVGAIMTVTFTVGEPGKAPGTGVPDGSSFLVLLVPKHGGTPPFAKAEGSNGRYRVTHWVPRGGLKLVQVGGWLNRRPVTAAGGFFIPITVVNHPY